ncbi:hypothetical protein PP633_14870 [Mycobacteroides abscessus]|uniref:hypothetical protein n=1 Tax=Mycobacteroides abscessus TaxID=36809 RepID=UPI0009A6F2F0|nr:hypothetical protein [Mycobacteroides abscessus]MDM2645611.1 hypothetical protein [Mycobacteroides abscessus]MDM2656032.1 hypothetical protein [Mycobacteroides abscessus]MDM2664255.1 hypothetical protein [Mycobacteroides abscessus]MDM2668627.1 hypothetical protein [Mycobacteroides abscessus]MDM2672475.1 hypothetical protein [Mycobacteroides abscessus]
MAEDSDEIGNDLTWWVAWLDTYMADLPALPGETAVDFCEAVGDLWQTALTARTPVPESAAALILLEVARTFAQVTMAAALDERVSRAAAEASLLEALRGVRNDAQTWLDTTAPTAEVIASRVEAVRRTFKQAQDAAANRIAEDESDDQYAIAHPYGAILGYQDPTVDADIIFTQVCEFTEEEHNRYGEAYDRLKRRLDQDLLNYVSDMSDSLVDVVCDVLRDIQNQRFSLSNMEEVHKRIRRIRSALIAFTSALHSHQEQTLYQVKHKFGKESGEHLAIKKLFNDIYSNCFGYRWLIELRHVMLHVNMDAFTVTLTGRLHDEATIELGMSRHWMSKSSGVMDKAYKRTELEAMSEDPNVLNMIRDLQATLGPLQDEIDAIMFPTDQLAEDSATVRDLIGRFNGRRGLYALQTGPGFTRRFRTPPFSQLDPRVLTFADQHEASETKT